MPGLSDAGRSFIEEMEKLNGRLERLERCARLALVPVKDYLPNLTTEKVGEFLNGLVVRDADKSDYDKEKWTDGDYTGYFQHQPSGQQFKLEDHYYDTAPEGRWPFYDILLDIAVAEQMSLKRLLVEIDPNLMSAVDACASVVDSE